MILKIFNRLKNISLNKYILIFSVFSLLIVSLISSVYSLYILIPENKSINIKVDTFKPLDDFILTYNQSVKGQVIVRKDEPTYINYKIKDGEGTSSALINGNDSFITYLEIELSLANNEGDLLSLINDYSYQHAYNKINYAPNTYFALENIRNSMYFISSNNENSIIAHSNFPIARNVNDNNYTSATLTLQLPSHSTYDEILLDIEILSKPSQNYEYAYLVGTMSNPAWDIGDEYYKMTPTLDKNYIEFQWIASDVNDPSTHIPLGAEFKGKKGDIWCNNQNNYICNGFTVSEIYWNGFNSGQLYGGVHHY